MSELGELVNQPSTVTSPPTTPDTSGQVLGENSTQAQFTLRFNIDTNAFTLQVNNVSQVTYALEYRATIGDSDTVTKQGFTDQGQANSAGVFTATQVAGSQSGDDFTPHQVIDGLVRLLTTDQSGDESTITATFELEQGQIVITDTQVNQVEGQVQGESTAATQPEDSNVTVFTSQSAQDAQPINAGSVLGAASGNTLLLLVVAGGVLVALSVGVTLAVVKLQSRRSVS